jgi:hypothetical protein
MTTSANDVPLSRLGPLLEVIRMAKEAPLAPQRLGGASIFSEAGLLYSLIGTRELSISA